MSCTHLTQDDCDVAQQTQVMVSPLKYQMYSAKYNQCNWCPKHNVQGLQGFTSDLGFSERVTIENDLMNINRKASKCGSEKFKPTCPTCSIVVPTGAKFASPLLCERDITPSNLKKPSSTGVEGVGSWGTIC